MSKTQHKMSSMHLKMSSLHIQQRLMQTECHAQQCNGVMYYKAIQYTQKLNNRCSYAALLGKALEV